jgi:hypothetical protein
VPSKQKCIVPWVINEYGSYFDKGRYHIKFLKINYYVAKLNVWSELPDGWPETRVQRSG